VYLVSRNEDLGIEARVFYSSSPQQQPNYLRTKKQTFSAPDKYGEQFFYIQHRTKICFSAVKWYYLSFSLRIEAPTCGQTDG
jgi:hypothetical protein